MDTFHIPDNSSGPHYICLDMACPWYGYPSRSVTFVFEQWRGIPYFIVSDAAAAEFREKYVRVAGMNDGQAHDLKHLDFKLIWEKMAIWYEDTQLFRDGVARNVFLYEKVNGDPKIFHAGIMVLRMGYLCIEG